MRPRYEFKYVLAPGQIEQVRAYAQTYLERDALGDDGCYIVTSLYYDTMDWRFAADVREGLRERIKLRVRHYEGPATFAEIKERVGLTILKERALIPAGLVDHVVLGTAFNGELPQPLRRWCALRDSMVLHPRVWVAYDREAWQSPFGDGARLTFDRHVRVQAPRVGRTRPPRDGWMPFRSGDPARAEIRGRVARLDEEDGAAAAAAPHLEFEVHGRGHDAR